MLNSDKIQTAAQRLLDAPKVVVLTGAGVSKESGVPTFRDALDGLWAKYDPQQLATPAAFRANPKLVWDWYEYRRQMVEAVKPNPGHYALAELETLIPQVVIVTQNVDGLHQMAGSSDVIPLHGNIRQHKCFANCQGEPTLIDVNTLTWDRESGPPLCPHCGAFVRPDVVWFTESLPHDAFTHAIESTYEADVFLVVGTSGLVEPAASLPRLARSEANAYLIDVNPVPDELTPYVHLFLQGPSGEILPQVVMAMRDLKS
jgi:NAD-dependent deacetylase